MVEDVSAVVRHIQVGQSVVVVITHGKTGPIPLVTDTRVLSDVRELTAAEISVKPVGAFSESPPCGISIAVDEVEVKETIRIEVDPPGAANCALRHVAFAASAVLVHEIDPGCEGNVRETRTRGLTSIPREHADHAHHATDQNNRTAFELRHRFLHATCPTPLAHGNPRAC